VVHVIQVSFKPGIRDVFGERTRSDIVNFLKIPIDNVRTRRVYAICGELTNEQVELLKKDVFADPIIETTETNQEYDWIINIGFKPGVTDNVGRTSSQTISDIIKGFNGTVHTSMQYLLSGNLQRKDVERIADKLLANKLINTVSIFSKNEKIKLGVPVVKGDDEICVNRINLNVSDSELLQISRKGVLSLNLEEMKVIRDYFNKKGRNPTDVELECLAQTWSEHCKHKIFNAVIEYSEYGKTEIIDGLFNSYIKKATEEVNPSWILSVFHDNAGVIRFNDDFALVYKVETHNSPSALDPYGGAMTGIVGVNRDPFGTGRGAKLMFNVWGYCFASPYYDKPVPKGLLHPKRVRDGVHKGVIDGGNQSGIPYARGWEYFDKRFLGKPLVYCGTVGVMPLEINGEPCHKKTIHAGDLIVMVGGRIGKDGIHGATFSSEELHSDSPVQAVQIGDPITQKKMTDFLLEARDLGLYTCITDNGAGGLSSSVGETARFSGGCEFDLKLAPLKYSGLQPWEILISEAQERMTLAVPPEKIQQFRELAERRGVEVTVLGKYTASGKFVVKYGEIVVADLDMDFLHDGVPQMHLKAEWKKPIHEEPTLKPVNIKDMLRRLNICSNEKKCRQYDHEVKGLSVIKPFIGRNSDVPSDATVFKIDYESDEGVILSEGVNPGFSDIDTYWMSASIIDEAVRKIISVGGKLSYIAGLDNFCWPDPLNSPYKLAQLVRANKGLYDFTKFFGIPLISGKDSMKNDCNLGGRKISIPLTLLFSAVSKIDNVKDAITMDVKCEGDLVYVVGETFNELGGSEYYKFLGFIGNNIPKIKKTCLSTYQRVIHVQKLVHSIHAPTKGGLGVGFAKMCIGGNMGMIIDLSKVPSSLKRNEQILYSESNSRFIITIPPKNRKEFEKILPEAKLVGKVGGSKLIIKGLGGLDVVNETIEDLRKAWKEVLE